MAQCCRNIETSFSKWLDIQNLCLGFKRIHRNVDKKYFKKSKNSEKNKIMIREIHYFITRLKTKIDVTPRSCFKCCVCPRSDHGSDHGVDHAFEQGDDDCGDHSSDDSGDDGGDHAGDLAGDHAGDHGGVHAFEQGDDDGCDDGGDHADDHGNHAGHYYFLNQKVPNLKLIF